MDAPSPHRRTPLSTPSRCCAVRLQGWSKLGAPGALASPTVSYCRHQKRESADTAIGACRERVCEKSLVRSLHSFLRCRVARAFYRQLPTSVKKLTPVAKLVRKMRVEDALLQCDLIRKKGAVFVQNAIRSARANGVHNDGLDPSKLFVEHCFATNGRDLKRIKMHGRGKFGRMKRRRTHLTVILREDPSARPSPHRIIDTWMQRQLKREQGIEKTAGMSHREMKAHAARVKWTTQLRRMRLKEREKRREAKRQVKRMRCGTISTLKRKKKDVFTVV